jgi:hypothetical protein
VPSILLGISILRNRIVKEGFFRNYELAQLPPLTRILFEGLWCLADKNGRLWDRAQQIKAECLPYDECEIENMLADLQKTGFILRYEASNRKCIQVVNFEKHQPLTTWEKNTSGDIPAPKNFKRTSKPLQTENRSTSSLHSTVQNSNEQNRSEVIEPPWNGAEFLSALSDFEQHRKEKHDALKPTSRKLLYRKFELWGEQASTAAMLESIANGWTGVFNRREGNGTGAQSKAERSQQAARNVIARYEREDRESTTNQ